MRDVFANYAAKKGLMTKLYKELRHLNNNDNNETTLENWHKI